MFPYKKPLKRSSWIILVVSVLVIGFFVMDTLESRGELPDSLQDLQSAFSTQTAESEQVIEPQTDEQTIPVTTDDSLKVHFIDVGQGESIFVEGPSANVLIDAGEVGSENIVIPYLQQLGVEEIDYLIATHPHSDHIGGMPKVIETFTIGEVIMPDIPDDLIPTTRVFTNLLKAVQEKNLSITTAEPNTVYDLGDQTILTLLGPVGSYDDLNNYSVVARLDCNDVSFLFTGDAEKKAEQNLLAEDANLAATVLSVGHHGSSTSTGADFLAAVNPSVAVISCGIDNSYGHPHRETLAALQDISCEVYRTDLDGTIVMETDGTDITVILENLVPVVD